MTEVRSTYLITGGTGFLGSHVALRLARDGDRVICYDVFVEGTPLDAAMNKKEETALTFVRGDVTDFDNLVKVLREHRVESVIHLASILAPDSESNRTLATRVNILGTNHVFEAARVLSLRKVVWASSVTVWGHSSDGQIEHGHAVESVPLTDDAPHCPTTVYGHTKSAGEFMSRYLTTRFGVDITGLRMSRVVGIGKVHGGGREFINLLGKVARNQPVSITNGDYVRSYAHADDMSRALVLAARSVRPKTPIFNTHGFECCTNRQLAGLLRELEPTANITVEPSAPGAFRGHRFDPSAIAAELGYTPRYSLKDTLREVLAALKASNMG